MFVNTRSLFFFFCLASAENDMCREGHVECILVTRAAVPSSRCPGGATCLSPAAGAAGSPLEQWWWDLSAVPDCPASKPGFQIPSQRLCTLLILPYSVPFLLKLTRVGSVICFENICCSYLASDVWDVSLSRGSP